MRALIVIAVLLLAGTGEAGELFTFTSGNGATQKVVDTTGNTLIVCEENQACVASKSFLEQQSCYQRMQEAMRAMNERIGLIYHERSFRGGASLRDAMGSRHMTQWDRTMQECVK